MAASETLFLLIKSMTRTEKAYFKKFSHKGSTNKNNDFFKLFDAIDKQSKYNERQLLKKFKTSKIVKQFSATKNYLYNLILDSLKGYHRNNSVEAQLHALSEEIDILYKKGLYQLAFKSWSKAFKLAERFEKFPYLMRLLHWKDELLHVSADIKGIKEYIEEGFEQEKYYANLWLNYRNFRKLCVEFYVLIREHAARRDIRSHNRINTIVEHPLMQDSNNAKSVKAKSQMYYVLAKYYRMMNDAEQTYKFRKKHFQLVEDNPQFMEESKMTFLRTLNNLIIAQSMLSLHEELEESLSKVKNFNSDAQNERVEAFAVYAGNALNYLCNIGVPEDKLSEIEYIEQHYPKFEEELQPVKRTVTQFLLGKAYFILGDFDKALDWLLDLEDKAQKNVGLDFLISGKLITLIIHYELNHTQYLDYANLSTYRFLRNKDRLYQVEIQLLKFLRKLTQLPLNESPTPLLEQFKQELLELQKDEFEAAAFSFFDLITWVNSKLQSIDFRQMLLINSHKQ
ncbi:MAG: hypothetical protein GY810_22940 [Aureispira sp.]|nr:hypothetical protein [Aureispira sp.]